MRSIAEDTTLSSPGETGGQMLSGYRRWQEALSAEFFDSRHAFQSTVLYVDDEAESELARRHGIDASLAEAVAGELSWSDHGGSLFSRIKLACRVWAQGERSGPPPSLPVLALSVLAATRMESSAGMLRTNFYGRWIRLFGEQPSSFRANKLGHDFEDVAQMWQDLDAWLKQARGRYGTSTVSTDTFYWKIGFPISQALVRGSDRQILTRFFAVTRLRPHNADGISGRELLRRLRVWTTGRDRRLSPRLMAELAGAADSGESLIAGLVKRLADDWDGTLHEPERERRRRAVGLRLMLTARGGRLEWLAEACDGLDETRVAMAGSPAFTLHKEDYGGIYGGLELLQPSCQQLEHGFHLEGEDLVLEWVPQEVVLLRMHPYLGEWVSTEFFEPGEQHWVLAADSAADKVRSLVADLGGRAVREERAPVAGWWLYKSVRAVDGPAFAHALDRGRDYAHVLESQIRECATLIGGLRIAPEYRAGGAVAGHYLRGGAPDLLLPTDDSPDGLIEVILDGRHEKLRTDPRVPFPLHVIGLEDGEHRVGTAASSQVFTLLDGLHEGLPPGTGTLGYACDGAARPEPGEVEDSRAAIRGAEAPASIRLPRIVLVRSEVLDAVLIDPRGRVRYIKKQSVPPWMADRLPRDASGPCLEAEVPEGYVWLVYKTRARWSAKAVGAEVPPPAPAPNAHAWAYAVLHAAEQCRASSWSAYVAAAKAIAEGGKHDG